MINIHWNKSENKSYKKHLNNQTLKKACNHGEMYIKGGLRAEATGNSRV